VHGAYGRHATSNAVVAANPDRAPYLYKEQTAAHAVIPAKLTRATPLLARLTVLCRHGVIGARALSTAEMVHSCKRGKCRINRPLAARHVLISPINNTATHKLVRRIVSCLSGQHGRSVHSCAAQVHKPEREQ